eukprot:scaffold106430_cov21-Tisochrysis_lutea.AAC.2
MLNPLQLLVVDTQLNCGVTDEQQALPSMPLTRHVRAHVQPGARRPHCCPGWPVTQPVDRSLYLSLAGHSLLVGLPDFFCVTAAPFQPEELKVGHLRDDDPGHALCPPRIRKGH